MTSWLTNIAARLVYGPGGGGAGGRVSANEYRCVHGAQINFGDLTPYLTYALLQLKNTVLFQLQSLNPMTLFILSSYVKKKTAQDAIHYLLIAIIVTLL